MALLSNAVEPQPAPVGVTSIRHWSLGSTTRVAVELSAETQFKVERLTNPDRLSVDLVGTRLRLATKAARIVQVGDRQVRQVRAAQKDLKTVRIVLDLEGRLEHEISQLASPNRIMIEVRQPGSAKPAEPATTSSRRRNRRGETQTASVTVPPPAPEQPKHEAAKPATPKPDEPKPEPVKAEPTKPEPVKADVPAPAEPVREPEREPVIPPSSNAPNASPQAALPNSTGSRSLTRALGLKLGRVVLDAGHGAHDHGSTGPAGLAEKDLVLDVALRLGALIEQRLGAEVIYTRSTDVFIPLEERSAIANKSRADLFLSIHANASPIKSISGAEVYYLNFTNSRDALEVAARENAAHGKSIFELRELIQKIALNDRLDESREFATRIEASLVSTWSKMNPTARNRGVKKAPFVVLIGSSMPAVLAEIGFISNPRDEALLRKPEHRQRIAEALFSGIQAYASSLSQLRSAAAVK